MNKQTVKPEKVKTNSITYYKIGAILYGLWGFWHFHIVLKMFEFASSQMETGILQARIYQGAFHILWFAVATIIIAVLFNWHNSRLGYWANLIMIGWTEVGLLLFFILPGFFPWLPTGFVGPLLWISAVLFSTLGYCVNPKKT